MSAAAAAAADDAAGMVHGQPGTPSLAPAEFAAIAAIMQSDARIQLTDVKKTLVHGRLSRRLRMHGVESFRDYVRMVQSDPVERAEMVVALTTNHTHFFRENHHFEHFRTRLVPTLRRQARSRPVRIWSAGCSSGEEVYTIGMCLLGQDRAEASWQRGADIKLLATDIAPHVVQSVARATYSSEIVAAIPKPYRDAWVMPAGRDFAMAPQLRDLVTARVLNLFDPWPMKQRYDVIFCRNVMIYFGDSAKEELEQRFVDMLAPGGHLYIGHSERLIGPAAKSMQGCGQTIYVKRGGAA